MTLFYNLNEALSWFWEAVISNDTTFRMLEPKLFPFVAGFMDA